jgi:hypothetical protein
VVQKGQRTGHDGAHLGGTMARWREDGAEAAVRSVGTDTRPRKERRG